MKHLKMYEDYYEKYGVLIDRLKELEKYSNNNTLELPYKDHLFMFIEIYYDDVDIDVVGVYNDDMMNTGSDSELLFYINGNYIINTESFESYVDIVFELVLGDDIIQKLESKKLGLL